MDGIFFANVEGICAISMQFEGTSSRHLADNRVVEAKLPAFEAGQGLAVVCLLEAEVDHQFDEFRQEDIFLQDCIAFVVFELPLLTFRQHLALIVFINELGFNGLLADLLFLDLFLGLNHGFELWRDPELSRVKGHPVAQLKLLTVVPACTLSS